MKHHIFVMASLVFLCLILTPHISAESEEISGDKILLWTEYETSPTIYDVAVGDTYVWGAHPQGAIRWHKQNQTYKIFTEANGLLDSYVTAVEVDNNGHVWFGSESGLSRFDGTKWSHYIFKNGSNNIKIWSISMGNGGKLLVGTGIGLFVFNGTDWTYYIRYSKTDPNGCFSNPVTDAAMDSRGKIWVSIKSAPTCYLENGKWKILFLQHTSVSSDQVEISANGDLWLAGASHENEEGVMRLKKNGTWLHYTVADGLLDDKTSSVTVDKNGGVWVGINGYIAQGVSYFDGSTWKSYIKTDGYYGGAVFDIAADDDGGIWTGGNYNVSRFNNNDWQAYLSGPPEGRIIDMTFDLDGHLWMSLDRNGVIEFDGQKWVHYTEADGLNGDYIYAILVDQNNDLWFACYNEEWGMVGMGLTRFDRTNWTSFTIDDGLAGNYINDLIMDDEGILWIAYRSNGVGRKTSNGWENYTIADGLLNDRVASIYTFGGDIWVAYRGGHSFDSGASRFNGTNWINYESELPFENVVNFATDNDGNLLALARDGVNKFDGESWTGFAIPLMSDFIKVSGNFEASEIGVDKNGVLWIVGYDSLFTNDGNSWNLYHELTTPFSGLRTNLAVDATGNNVWISSKDGMVKLQLLEIVSQIYLPTVQK